MIDNAAAKGQSPEQLTELARLYDTASTNLAKVPSNCSLILFTDTERPPHHRALNIPFDYRPPPLTSRDLTGLTVRISGYEPVKDPRNGLLGTIVRQVPGDRCFVQVADRDGERGELLVVPGAHLTLL